MRLRYYNTETNNVYKFYMQYLQVRNSTFAVTLCYLYTILHTYHNFLKFTSLETYNIASKSLVAVISIENHCIRYLLSRPSIV